MRICVFAERNLSAQAAFDSVCARANTELFRWPEDTIIEIKVGMSSVPGSSTRHPFTDAFVAIVFRDEQKGDPQ